MKVTRTGYRTADAERTFWLELDETTCCFDPARACPVCCVQEVDIGARRLARVPSCPLRAASAAGTATDWRVLGHAALHCRTLHRAHVRARGLVVVAAEHEDHAQVVRELLCGGREPRVVEMTKAQLAHAISAKPEIVRRLLTAKSPNPTLATVVKVAAALGFTVQLVAARPRAARKRAAA